MLVLPPRAVLIGAPLVAELTVSVDARVHSVFRRAINLERAGGLITLARHDIGGLPGGVLLDRCDDLRALGAAAGQAAIVDPELLRVEEAGLAIPLAGARVWNARISVGRADRAALTRALARATAALPPVGLAPLLVAAGSENAFVSAARRKVEEIQRLAFGARPEEAALASKGLVGLGEGLTPSGDDVLVGMSAILTALRHPLGRSIAREAAAAGMETTRVSAAFLTHAARGDYAERVHRVVRAILTDHGVERAIREALDWGATSGADLMTGCLLGARIALR